MTPRRYEHSNLEKHVRHNAFWKLFWFFPPKSPQPSKVLFIHVNYWKILNSALLLNTIFLTNLHLSFSGHSYLFYLASLIVRLFIKGVFDLHDWQSRLRRPHFGSLRTLWCDFVPANVVVGWIVYRASYFTRQRSAVRKINFTLTKPSRLKPTQICINP